jgi:hypothetical protein
LFPFVAGLFAIGDRDGPKIYPSSYHTILYMISYEMVRDEKPRQSPFFERPWFYGFPRKRREIKNEPSNPTSAGHAESSTSLLTVESFTEPAELADRVIAPGEAQPSLGSNPT